MFTVACPALSILSTRPCPSSLFVLIRLPPALALELAILCALLGVRLTVLGCIRERGGSAERGAESMLASVSSPVNVPFPMPSSDPNPNLSPTPCRAGVCRRAERPIVRSMKSSSSASLAPPSSSSSSLRDMGGRCR